MIRGFIFDLDGVLTDTAEFHYRAWKRLADEEGLPFNRTDNEQLRGVSRRESLLRLLKGRSVAEEQLGDWMSRKNAYYLQLIGGMTPADVLPGVRSLLADVRLNDMKTALGSASRNAREVIARLELETLLDAVADGASVERQKPAPDLFLHAAALLGLAPSECAVVEDAAAGIEAARRGGFRTVGLGPSDRVGAADVIFPDLSAVTASQLIDAVEMISLNLHK